jgi:TPP-dependent pyruvate/acetoin dehydrogenase alpha subunit
MISSIESRNLGFGINENKKLLEDLLFRMLKIRIVEEKIAELYREQEMRCPVHLCIGQEAIAAGVCANLTDEDYVLSTHRSHGHYLAKGGDIRRMIAEIYGRSTGCSYGKGGSMHLIDLDVGYLGSAPIVGSTIPIAVGTAFGSTMRGDSQVTVVFFGEGATEEGVFHESLNFALLKELPVVFVCENNLFSVYSPMEVRQPKIREVYELARGHGIQSYQGDGNDVVQVYKKTRGAINKARIGGGPTFLEFQTYRWREHCGPFYDNDIGYRTELEFLKWKNRCPIERMESHLIDEGILERREMDQIVLQLKAEMEDAVNFAKTSSVPEDNMLMEHLYAS